MPTKAELITHAESLGIEVNPKSTKAVLEALIEERVTELLTPTDPIEPPVEPEPHPYGWSVPLLTDHVPDVCTCRHHAW